LRSQHSALGTLFSSLLLRFDPSPRRVALGFLAAAFASLGLLLWLNVLPQFWSNKLGFEVQPDSAGVASTPIPIEAVSSSYGASGSNAPGLVLAQPGDGSQVSILTSPVVMRFDMPMDRGSVEDALLITPPAAGTLSWDADNQLRWIPSAPGLLRGITYTVTLSGTALSVAGTPLRGISSWSFRTSDPYAVVPAPADGASIGPTESCCLAFDAPMQADLAQAAVSLRPSDSHQDIPAGFSWDADSKRLTVTPLRPLPEGYISVLVDATAPTQSGDTLGRSYEFKYRAELPTPRVRLLDGRIALPSAGHTAPINYEAVSDASSAGALDGVSFEVYAFPAEKLSALGAQASSWPQALPQGFSAGLELVGATGSPSLVPAASGEVFLPDLPAGIYLVVARGLLLSDQESSGAALTDWQLLVVGDRKLVSAGSGMPLWAVTETGRAWAEAELSLYSPEGALLEKGITSSAGLYSPSMAARGATLAVARDPSGHVAPLLLDTSFQPRDDTATNTLLAGFVTDRQAYRPGDVVNFRAGIQAITPRTGNAAYLDEPSGNIATVQLLTPQGYLVSSLSLKPDASGGVGGLFTLASSALPGKYTVRVRWADASQDFPLDVLSPDRDALSVAVLPSEEDAASASITRTVSVLGPAGKPQASAIVTGTLGILGDLWTSEPVVATTNGAGMVTFAMPLPGWADRFKEPGLFFRTEASSDGLVGADTHFLDLTSQRSAASGQTQAVAPLQNVAVVARMVPAESLDAEAHFRVRAVLLDPNVQSGSVLLTAQAPTGERLHYSLDLASLPGGDATITLPLRFAGGSISILSPNVSAARMLRLIPAGTGAADLRVLSAVTTTASSEVPVTLTLSSFEGASLAGNASLVWRRVSGAASELATAWQPGIAITASGAVTVTMQAPSVPGLWYLVSEATTEAGVAHGWAAVRVLPAPWLQLPPSIQAEAGVATSFGVRVFNPGDSPLQVELKAVESDSHVESGGSKSVTAPANRWIDQPWQLSASRPGDSIVSFLLLSPDAGSTLLGDWPLAVRHKPYVKTDVTYTAGALTGERNVGVTVPWDLDLGQLTLEIRASTSLLASLAGTVRDLHNTWTSPSESVSMAAARLSTGAPVASAYGRSGAALPAGLLLSGAERSTLLQQLYAAQQPDGSWSYSLEGDGMGSMAQTAAVLLAFYRSSYYPYGDGNLNPDEQVIARALAYLSSELARPIRADASSTTLDARAYALYAFSLYRPVADDWSRPLLAYGITDPAGEEASLSPDGQGYLALALMQLGRMDDALALLETAHRLQPAGSVPASAPMLIASLQAESDSPANVQPFTSSYAAVRNPQSGIRNSRYVQTLMGEREGAGWHTPLSTADAIWALALYAAMEGEHPRSDMPTLLLGDRPIRPADSTGIPGELSVLLSGSELRAGTNWLKLRSPASGEPLYYSLTLIAAR
jgi:tetratricopeptide (TPR) repeat protein